MTGAESHLMHLDVTISHLCGDFLARVLGSGLRRCVQSQVRTPGDSLGHAEKNLSSVIPFVLEEDVASPEERIPFLLKEGKMT